MIFAVFLPNNSTDELFIETVSLISVMGLSERASDSVIKPLSDVSLSSEPVAVRDTGLFERASDSLMKLSSDVLLSIEPDLVRDSVLSEMTSDSAMKPPNDVLLSIELDAVKNTGCSSHLVGVSKGFVNVFHISLEQYMKHLINFGSYILSYPLGICLPFSLKLIHIKTYMSQCMRFPTMWYVRPAKPQISLRIRKKHEMWRKSNDNNIILYKYYIP